MKLDALTIAALLATVILAPRAVAVTAGPGPRLGVVDIGGLVYIADEGLVGGNGVRIYLEADGQDGLQRGDCSPAVPRDCYHVGPVIGGG